MKFYEKETASFTMPYFFTLAIVLVALTVLLFSGTSDHTQHLSAKEVLRRRLVQPEVLVNEENASQDKKKPEWDTGIWIIIGAAGIFAAILLIHLWISIPVLGAVFTCLLVLGGLSFATKWLLDNKYQEYKTNYKDDYGQEATEGKVGLVLPVLVGVSLTPLAVFGVLARYKRVETDLHSFVSEGVFKVFGGISLGLFLSVLVVLILKYRHPEKQKVKYLPHIGGLAGLFSAAGMALTFHGEWMWGLVFFLLFSIVFLGWAWKNCTKPAP
jgi:nicotinamide riboside transporter PnuC